MFEVWVVYASLWLDNPFFISIPCVGFLLSRAIHKWTRPDMKYTGYVGREFYVTLAVIGIFIISGDVIHVCGVVTAYIVTRGISKGDGKRKINVF